MRAALPIIVTGTSLIATCYGLARFAYGLFLPEIRDDIGLSAAGAGLIASGAYASYCIAIAASAFLVESLGPRIVSVAAALIAALSMAMIAISHSAGFLAVAVLLTGLCTGLASPPMAQAVSVVVRESRQPAANTIINAGTSFGVIASGPIALLATGQWRMAYAVFSAAACLTAVALVLCMPDRLASRANLAEPGSQNSLFRKDAVILAMAASGMGAASAVYWTFASDYLVSLATISQGDANRLWVLVGISGLLGAFAGGLVSRLGINAVHRIFLVCLSGAITLLTMTVYAPPSVAVISSVLFGSSYIMLTGVYLVWGVRVFSDRPAIGLGMPFLMIAVGQVLGASVAGSVISLYGFRMCFWLFALLALATLLMNYKPSTRSDTHELQSAAT